MERADYMRWGQLLGILAALGDVERQVVLQGHEPGAFVPDTLIEQWIDTFRGGRRLAAAGVPPQLIGILRDFDANLHTISEYLPHDAADRLAYIRHDEAWQAVRELANWTLSRIVEATRPLEVTQGRN